MKKQIQKIILVFAVFAAVFCTAAFAVPCNVQAGVVNEGGVTHIYNAKGRLMKNKPAYKVKVNGKTWYYAIARDGAAVRLKNVKAKAAARLCQLKAGGKKSEANLKKAFAWASGRAYQNNTKSSKKGMAAARYYGSYGFGAGRGDCNTVAAVFYWMATVLGYDAKFVQGYVPDGSITNLQSHAWVTIEMDGKTYVFDPDFTRVYASRFGKTCGFKISYGQKSTYIYFDAQRQKIG